MQCKKILLEIQSMQCICSSVLAVEVQSDHIDPLFFLDGII